MQNKIIFRLYQIDKTLPKRIVEPNLSLEAENDPLPEIYRFVWESRENPDLDILYNKYSGDKRPNSYVCRSLSVSDIVEIEDEQSDTFYICDNFGWTEIDFEKSEVPPEMGFRQWYVNTDNEMRKIIHIEAISKAVIQIMVERLQKSIKAVTSMFKHSKAYLNLHDEKTGLWMLSPYSVVDAFEKELKGGQSIT